MVVNDTLTWSTHVDSIVSKPSSRIGLLRRLKCSTSQLIVRDLYLYCVRPVIEYGQVAWAGLSAIDEKRLERINRSAARLISNTRLSALLPHQLLLARAGLEPLKVCRQVAQALACSRAACLHTSRWLQIPGFYCNRSAVAIAWTSGMAVAFNFHVLIQILVKTVPNFDS